MSHAENYIHTASPSIQPKVRKGAILALPLSVLDLIRSAPRPAGPIPAPDFRADRESVNDDLDLLIPAPRGTVNAVTEAMRYAVFGGGQRVRPLLSLRIARVLEAETPAVLRAAACAELVHCASLIVDDLPCMDNSSTRRGLPATHVRFGESTAILAAFSLVALAARSTAALPHFQRNLLGVLDPGSLIRGQALDLESPAPARSALITELKTVPLFELAVEAGGVSSSEYDRREQELRRFARAFGLAFQMVDDYLDHDTDDPEPALDQLRRARNAAEELGPRAHHVLELVNYLDVKLSEDRSHR